MRWVLNPNNGTGKRSDAYRLREQMTRLFRFQASASSTARCQATRQGSVGSTCPCPEAASCGGIRRTPVKETSGKAGSNSVRTSLTRSLPHPSQWTPALSGVLNNSPLALSIPLRVGDVQSVLGHAQRSTPIHQLSRLHGPIGDRLCRPEELQKEAVSNTQEGSGCLSPAQIGVGNRRLANSPVQDRSSRRGRQELTVGSILSLQRSVPDEMVPLGPFLPCDRDPMNWYPPRF